MHIYVYIARIAYVGSRQLHVSLYPTYAIRAMLRMQYALMYAIRAIHVCNTRYVTYAIRASAYCIPHVCNTCYVTYAIRANVCNTRYPRMQYALGKERHAAAVTVCASIMYAHIFIYIFLHVYTYITIYIYIVIYLYTHTHIYREILIFIHTNIDREILRSCQTEILTKSAHH